MKRRGKIRFVDKKLYDLRWVERRRSLDIPFLSLRLGPSLVLRFGLFRGLFRSCHGVCAECGRFVMGVWGKIRNSVWAAVTRVGCAEVGGELDRAPRVSGQQKVITKAVHA